ncbi:efflux RND transporter permease subunit [Cetobacterium sp. 2G large]|uniref:efflux RND transporter permease subunit n=1 Tax=Cetobacterium sp. 2G large TaxID=2759680 RepID=UPI00163C6892|nr:efflux RND transporter permease subunit [Cetobacterium sp. 2G large]MBC2854438.1 efflux RND transporter permease subunit [Cetobacterium sp. 2G large]
MKLTELAIKNKVTTYFLIVILLIGGYLSYDKSEKAQDPGFTIKVALITTNWPGATAKQMADLVSKRIADQVQNMDSLWYVNSTNTDGQSNVYVNIKAEYKDIQPVWTELRNRINTFVVPNLPQGVQAPQINTFYGDIYGTLLAIGGEGYTYEELYETAYQLKEVLLFNVPQIGSIDISGIQNETVYIDIDNKLLSQTGLTLENIINTLNSSNVIIKGGNIVIDQNRLKVTPSGNFKNIEDIKDTIITSPNGDSSIYLSEVANIYKSYQDPSTYSIDFNGNKSLVLGISLGSGEDVLLMGKGIQETLKTYRNSLPIGLEIGEIYYLPDLVQTNVTAFIVNLFQAVTTIVLVMLVFLGLRSGLIVAALTPTSIAFTLIGLFWFNYGINQITLAGLIIALGMLVDNAVVMSENITVLLEEGKPRMQACLESSRTLAIPLFVSSLTTIMAFSPIILNKENMGEYVGPLTIVVMLALMSSWLINQTFIPLLCYDFIKLKPGEKQNLNSKPYVLYREILIKVLKNKKITIILTAISFVFGIWLLGLAPANFMPGSTDPVMSTYITLPKGTDVNQTRAVVEDLNKFIEKNYSTGPQEPLPPGLWDYLTTGGTTKTYDKAGVLSWGSFIGGGAPRFSTGYSPQTQLPEYAYIMYNLTDYRLIPKLSQEINEYLLNKYPDIDVVSKGLGSGVSLAKDLGYVFASRDITLLKKVAEEVKTKLTSLDGTYAVSDDWGIEVPKIFIEVDTEKAQMAGFTNDTIGTYLEYVLQGYNASVYRNFDAPPQSTIIPIVLRGTDQYKNDLNSIQSIEVVNSKGQAVPLKQIAKISLEYYDSLVSTRNMAYSIEIDAAIKDSTTPLEVNKKFMPWLNEKLKEWGPDVKYYSSGIMQTSDENQQALFAQVPIAILGMFFLVVAQFNSMRKGLTIMLVIPLSILGVAIGLLLTNTDLGFMAMIGIIALAGVVLNHAIILVDKMTIEKDDLGRSDQDAVVFGCQSRLRPIFLTVATTLVGLLPLYFFGGPLFQPVAVVLIFGLVTDTFLALGVIPVIYALFYKIDFANYAYDESRLIENKPTENTENKDIQS